MSSENILENFLIEHEAITTLIDLNKLKSKYLGRNGIINIQFKQINTTQLINKQKHLEILNNIKIEITREIKNKHELILIPKTKIDFDATLPSYKTNIASQHIITKTINEIEMFFMTLGFNIYDGLELDSLYYNFDALNMPLTHPSRSMHETFYINNDVVLRTHTSNMQIHIMETNKPPLKIISYGKVYRKDYDASHTPMFHQIEGMIIDKNISLANLKHLLFNFLNFFFNTNVKINLRASYFPFTEPSMEIDIQCINCNGEKCYLCKNSGWIEILGCGMIHPNVLSKCNINNNYRGLAFGMGLERLSMIKYNIPDIRLYFENNIDFLKQF